MDLTVEDIDRVRVDWFSDYPEILVSDIAAFLVRVSQQTLFQLYRHSRKPIEAEMISAAAIYFYKFYMRESPRDFHPRAVLVACMNLAAKTEEYHAVGLSDLINALPDASDLKASVPRLEMKLLAALDYNLVVEQPWLVVLFWAEMIATAEDNLHLKVYDTACDLVRMWQFTDAVLIFSFPKIATAAVYKACKELSADGNNESLTKRLEAVLQKIIPNTNVAELLLSVEYVAYRFGIFEKVVKDPSIETTVGYSKLVSLSG